MEVIFQTVVFSFLSHVILRAGISGRILQDHHCSDVGFGSTKLSLVAKVTTARNSKHSLLSFGAKAA